MHKLHFFADDLAARYGHPLQRIPFDLHLSCPHRDQYGHGGCAFCAEDGSRARHLKKDMSLEEQCRIGVAHAARRYHAKPPYIAYFQAYTSTNAPVQKIRSLLETAMALADFRVMILSTRPDCLPDEILDLLEEWSRKTELWVELGVQTSCDETLKRINRGHDFACVQQAVQRLHDRGIHTAAHVILGLPGEDRAIMMKTADDLAALPFEAVKIHNLLVLKGTELASRNVTTLNEYEYASLLGAFIRRLPEKMLLMRLSSEAPEKQILAPQWWMKKSQFLEFFKEQFETDGSGRFVPCKTGDGSYTLYHPSYRQHFHSAAGAREESFKKYVEVLDLEKRLCEQEEVHVLDVGFGLGFNAGAAIRTAEKVRHGKLVLTSLECDRNVLEAARMLPEHHAPDLLEQLLATGCFRSEFAECRILFGDARQILETLHTVFDAVFLDGFSPDTNPELWTVDFIRLLYEKLKPGSGVAACFSDYPVIGSFLQCGFDLRLSEPFGRKRPGLAAFRPPCSSTAEHLSEKDLHIATLATAGIPYRDPDFRASRKEIFAARENEVKQKRLSGMPKWYK